MFLGAMFGSSPIPCPDCEPNPVCQFVVLLLAVLMLAECAAFLLSEWRYSIFRMAFETVERIRTQLRKGV